MTRFHSVLVEDEPTAATETRAALEAAGFSVALFTDASSALSGTSVEPGPIDLLVLDRRLPLRHGNPASDGVGDDLLDALLQQQPDLVVIVFSGHTDLSHAQFAMAKRGIVSLRQNDIQFDRVTAFEKGQSLEFDTHLQEIHACLSQMEDIQLEVAIDSEPLEPLTKRLLRRVGFEFEGTSVKARPLAGGLTGSPVWLCDIEGTTGPVARAVVKRQTIRPRQGGFQSLLPAPLTAGTVSIINGFCGGFYVSVQQVAGAEPVPLLDLLASDPTAAAQLLRSLLVGLSEIKLGQSVNRPIAAIASSFGEWDTMQARAAEHGIEVPPGSRIATTVVAPQHGDLHPGNVLAVGETPVVIDFDSQTDGSELLDAVALLLGPLFHRDSPLRNGAWPSEEQCGDILGETFLDGCPATEYYAEAIDWLIKRKRSDRELYAVLLAYVVRQLKYDDVLEDVQAMGRAIAIARWATENLSNT